MNDLQVFNNGKWQIRTVMKNGEPLFVAADVCAALEVSNSRDAITRLDADEVDSTDIIDTLGRTQTATAVTESGLYSLVLGSRKPEAKEFKRWITHDVLPAIRKTGMYVTEEAKAKLLRKAERDAAYALNAKSRAMNTIAKYINDSKLSPVAAAVFGLSEIQRLTGQLVQMPLPVEKTYSATEIAESLGVSAAMIGRLANAADMKNKRYGMTVLDMATNGKKQVESFRYNEAGRERLTELVAERQKKAKLA